MGLHNKNNTKITGIIYNDVNLVNLKNEALYNKIRLKWLSVWSSKDQWLSLNPLALIGAQIDGSLLSYS